MTAETDAPPALTRETRLYRTQNWLSALHDDTAIMMHGESGRFVGLNQTGTRIWELLETPCSLGELSVRLAGEFQVTPEQAFADMAPLLLSLVENGALSLAAPPAA
jgi:hypothetical protein